MAHCGARSDYVTAARDFMLWFRDFASNYVNFFPTNRNIQNKTIVRSLVP